MRLARRTGQRMRTSWIAFVAITSSAWWIRDITVARVVKASAKGVLEKGDRCPQEDGIIPLESAANALPKCPKLWQSCSYVAWYALVYYMYRKNSATWKYDYNENWENDKGANQETLSEKRAKKLYPWCIRLPPVYVITEKYYNWNILACGTCNVQRTITCM